MNDLEMVGIVMEMKCVYVYNITAAWAVDREFVDIFFPAAPPLGLLWGPFGLPWALKAAPRNQYWPPMGPQGSPMGPVDAPWAPNEPPRTPMGCPWALRGRLGELS